MRYFFHIGCGGTHNKGWQCHPYGVGVQQVIEERLQKILKQPVVVIGCGRTDAGLHASQFFFHQDVAQPWEFDMLFRLNKVLPPDPLSYLPTCNECRLANTLRKTTWYEGGFPYSHRLGFKAASYL